MHVSKYSMWCFLIFTSFTGKNINRAHVACRLQRPLVLAAPPASCRGRDRTGADPGLWFRPGHVFRSGRLALQDPTVNQEYFSPFRSPLTGGPLWPHDGCAWPPPPTEHQEEIIQLCSVSFSSPHTHARQLRALSFSLSPTLQNFKLRFHFVYGEIKK